MKHDRFYMEVARSCRLMSHDVERPVGCVVVKDGILAEGWSGTPAGFPNDTRDRDGNTVPEMVHAETNAIAKCARRGIKTEGAVIYTTLSPCFSCAKLILQSGIVEVIYEVEYFKQDGLDLLRRAGVKVRLI